ncbi:Intradiol ring-cleavage dioxygenase [Xylariomycetidae sp. FL2044]|nr:Intradiol ring-cleavage dioxygenase [Xylariomycetidae sp. FL2044]
MRFINTIAPFAILAGSVAAHGNHDIAQEIKERRDFLSTQKRTSLGHCATKLGRRGVHQRNVERRNAAVEAARVKRGLKQKRTFESVVAASHNKTSSKDCYTEDTAASALFADYNSCLLTPIVTQGPYYVADELIRRDIGEDLEGVPVTLDFQVVDINTCEPVANSYLEIWHANSTGVYSGVAVQGNGVGASDTANLDLTWGRGLQETDADGVATFDTKFPGHYTGRAIHIHTVVHDKSAVAQSNQTLGVDTLANHVGQVFFDQDLISLVEATAPYTTNEQALTLNADDSILETEAATDGVDPFMEYVLLGDSIEDGIFAWVSFGVNATYTKTLDPVVFLTEDGGVDNPNWNDEDGRPL